MCKNIITLFIFIFDVKDSQSSHIMSIN